jgi:hypothetical protein
MTSGAEVLFENSFTFFWTIVWPSPLSFLLMNNTDPLLAPYAPAVQAFFKAQDAWVKLVARSVECEFDRTPELSPSNEAIAKARQRAQTLADEMRAIAKGIGLSAQNDAEYLCGKNGF